MPFRSPFWDLIGTCGGPDLGFSQNRYVGAFVLLLGRSEAGSEVRTPLVIIFNGSNPPTPAGVNRRVGYVVNGNVWKTSLQTSGRGGGATSHGCGVTSSRIANNMHVLHKKITNN